MRFCGESELRELAQRFTDIEIGAQFHVSPVVVQRLRLEYRILRNRTHTLDEGFFATIDTPNKAYVLGLITADGHVSKDGKVVVLTLTESDRALIEIVRDLVGSTAPVHVRQPGKGAYRNSAPVARLELCSQRLVRDLNVLGLYHDKSVTATYPAIPVELEAHYVRGFFDGNGAITPNYFSFVGNLPLLQGIRDAFQRHTSCSLSLQPHRRAPLVHVLRGNGLAARAAAQWMYEHPSLRLERKFAVYLTYWTETPRT